MKFQPGHSGNPAGRKRGSRNKATLLRDRLVKRGTKLLDKLIALAEAGDTDALKFLLSRVIPPARDIPERVEASGDTVSDLASAIVREALAGRIAPDVARELTAALSSAVKLKEADEFEKRLAALESRIKPANDTEP